MMEEKKKDKKKKICIIILLLLILACSASAGIILWKKYAAPISPDYPPQGTQANQIPVEGDESEKMDSPSGGGAINVTYGLSAQVSLIDGKVSLYYANPHSSNQNVAITIMVGDVVVAKSDMITPGNQVLELELEGYAKTKLAEGGYNAELVIRAYDPESGEKAMIDTKGEITLTVEK